MLLQQYDTVIIGAGHNGLVCASYLARAGQKVLLLEAGNTPGGLASTREFYPGFRVSVAHSLNHFSPKVAADLDLARHGFGNAGSPMPTISLDAGGLSAEGSVRLHPGGALDRAAFSRVRMGRWLDAPVTLVEEGGTLRKAVARTQARASHPDPKCPNNGTQRVDSD